MADITEVRDWLTGEMIPVRHIEPGRETALDEWDALAALTATWRAIVAELDAIFGDALPDRCPAGRMAMLDGDATAVWDAEGNALERLEYLSGAIVAQVEAMTSPAPGCGSAPIRRIIELSV